MLGSTLELERTLGAAFNPEQAHILAAVISESYNQMVKASDFQELKAVVQELAEAQRALTEAQKRTESRVEELAEAQKRTEFEIRSLARQVGGLSESFGGSLEDFAIDVVPDLLEKHWGFAVEESGRDILPVNGKDIEFDLVIRGTLDGKPILVLGEVKSNLTESEVDRFIKQARSVGHDNEEVRIVFFGYRANKEAREKIKSQGAYMIFSHGKIL